MRRLLFLGTAHGMPIASSCACVLIEDESTNLLLDAGGGHDVIGQFKAAGKSPTEVRNIFISHYDSDHILGFVPLVRAFHRWRTPSKGKGAIRVFCSAEVKSAIDSLFTHVAKRHLDGASPHIEFIIVKDGARHEMDGWMLDFFDLKSKKTPQFGCAVTFPDGKKLAFLGDEPSAAADQHAKGADVLIHDAFCLDTEQETFKPHEKNHSTVREAAQAAARLDAKTLVLLHMEDTTLATRKERYGAEAARHFHGGLVVPVDLDTFEF